LFEISDPLILVLAPVITAIVAAIKMVGLPSRFAPLTSMAVGGALVTLFAEPGAPIRGLVLTGICAGLASSGLYAGTKAMGEKTQSSPVVTVEALNIIQPSSVSDFETEIEGDQ
jgi:hypothetical protein